MQTIPNLHSNDGMDTVKPALPEVLKVSDGTYKERTLTKSQFLAGEANDPTVWKLPILQANGEPSTDTIGTET